MRDLLGKAMTGSMLGAALILSACGGQESTTENNMMNGLEANTAFDASTNDAGAMEQMGNASLGEPALGTSSGTGGTGGSGSGTTGGTGGTGSTGGNSSGNSSGNTSGTGNTTGTTDGGDTGGNSAGGTVNGM